MEAASTNLPEHTITFRARVSRKKSPRKEAATMKESPGVHMGGQDDLRLGCVMHAMHYRYTNTATVLRTRSSAPSHGHMHACVTHRQSPGTQ